jgi:hypothetical protein
MGSGCPAFHANDNSLPDSNPASLCAVTAIALID